jgi:uncharacterized Zn-binding protein involved in type VI secretion
MNAARMTDICSGHGGYGSRSAISGSSDVFFNGLPAHRVTDAWEEHCALTCHDSILATGSMTVFINGLQAGRVGDIIECGSIVMTGSLDIFIGG